MRLAGHVARMGKPIEFRSANLKEGDHLEHLRVDGRITLTL